MSSKYSWTVVDYQDTDFIVPNVNSNIAELIGDLNGTHAVDFGENTFNFYGQTFSNCVVSTNGFITFNEEADLTESNVANVEICANTGIDGIFCVKDYFRANASLSGNIFVEFLNGGDLLSITYGNVEEIGTAKKNTFQIQLEMNTGAKFGEITLVLGNLDLSDNSVTGMIGLMPTGLSLTDSRYTEYLEYKADLDFSTRSTQQYDMPVIEANSAAMLALEFKVLQFFPTLDEAQINTLVSVISTMKTTNIATVKKLVARLSQLDLTNETREQLKLVIEQINKH
jgi:hypothetical protein